MNLPNNPNGGVLIIEVDDLSEQVVKNMLKAGVPVIEDLDEQFEK